MSKGFELGPISDSIKVALIVVVGLFVTVAVYQQGTPYNSCVRAMDAHQQANGKMPPKQSAASAHMACAKQMAGTFQLD